MSTSTSPSEPAAAAPPPEAPAAAAATPMSLNEFCTELSGRDRRVELIAAFAHIERAAGRHHDTRAAYAGRFAAVGSRPTTR